MSIQQRSAIVLVAFLSAMAFATTASAQAGVACSGTVCGLGGQIRGQVGNGLPLPISIAPGYSGAFNNPGNPLTNVNITIKTQAVTPNGLPPVGFGLGQAGQVKPTANATIMQTTAMAANRDLYLNAGKFHYDRVTEGSISLINFNIAIFAVQTNLIFDNPHPGFTIMNGVQGAATVMAPGVVASPTSGNPAQYFFAGGRSGAPTVSYYAGAVGNPSTNYGNGVPPGVPILPAAGNAGGINGVARFTATSNQFGGVSTGRTGGTAKVYFNVNAISAAGLPCTGGTGCIFGRTTVIPGTTGVAGGPFGASVSTAAATGFVYTGTIGSNGTILGTGMILTIGGINITTMGQAALIVGFPLTTGRLTMEVTDLAPGATAEKFIRSGTDARDANGNGVVAMVTGSMSARTTSKGNANRTWLTLEIPEPSAIFAASAGLFALFGCHRLVRRRSR